MGDLRKQPPELVDMVMQRSGLEKNIVVEPTSVTRVTDANI